MTKRALTTIFCVFMTSILLFSQKNNNTFYYYSDKKVSLKQRNDKILVKFANQTDVEQIKSLVNNFFFIML